MGLCLIVVELGFYLICIYNPFLFGKMIPFGKIMVRFHVNLFFGGYILTTLFILRTLSLVTMLILKANTGMNSVWKAGIWNRKWLFEVPRLKMF